MRKQLFCLIMTFTFTAIAVAEDHALAHGAVTRPGDGSPVCGLGKDFHINRRLDLRERLQEGIVLLRGLPEPRAITEFHQDKVFWYFTGIESPDATVLMNVATGEEILFLPEQSRRREMWEGEVWDASDEWVRELTGFTDIRANAELLETLDTWIDDDTVVWVSTSPWLGLSGGHDQAGPYDRHVANDPLDGRVSREKALMQQLTEQFGIEPRDMTPMVNAMRWVKQPEEIAAMKRAAQAGAIAMVEAIRSTAPGVGEWEIDALMSFVQIREGAAGPAYYAIVGSGKNSTVLHYHHSSKIMQSGELLLIDYGPQVDYYCTDITRTWPVSGSFTPKQAEMYDVVLRAQAAGIAAAKPGATMREVSEACSKVIREAGYGDNIRHGACHYIGLEVHDVRGEQRELVPGVAFTIEPGIYDEETGIGIRIEDVVIITEDGCEIITRDVPVEREAMESLVGEIGVLDYLRAIEDGV